MDSSQGFYTVCLKDICLGTKVYYFIYLTSLQRLKVVQNLYLHLFPNVWIFCFWKQRLSSGNPLPDVYTYLHVSLIVMKLALHRSLQLVICGSGLVFFFLLAAYVPAATHPTSAEGTVAVIPCWAHDSRVIGHVSAANLGFLCGP